ncbi:MAG: Inner-membrane translocator [Thermotoga sp. 50_1627]|uniref:branched-chain amino acid ABC transporter permease n=1 Tax=Pseudothermotoga sp. TaxID=2033661 RepID=UPI00076C3D36|nr:MAG: Inner-membrane translocator [Thermotoga sp. 50_64]KUK25443.1 MAG: Inner-membrane translocator [Thermotoga sp. 50_1627]MBC7115718.1 branched-chain amino acid ABC transporter permease [Pseudothermotoga sp.]MDK2923426.1 branched-chain amino acid transport system permease protein [Pseudothermotoga sp.]HCO97700.1 branched-chain amino acid ABC transporter permease [Pseudothermotoga sp.]
MFLNRLILGLSTGSFYSLAAMGIVLIFKVTGLMNFAYGNMAMFMAYVTYTFVSLGLGSWPALVLTLLVSMLFGYSVERFTLRPLRRLSHGSMLIVTFGLLMILEGLATQIWGTQYKSLPELMAGRPIIFRGDFGIVVFRRQDLLLFLVLAIVSLLVFLLYRFTKIGIAVRAVSENEKAAQLMGIDPNRVISWSWMAGTAIGTMVAVLGAPRTYVSPTMMIYYQIQGFTAAVLGGFDSLLGALCGGLALGVIESLIGGYISNELKTTLSLGIIVGILLIRPQGLFGSEEIRRV